MLRILLVALTLIHLASAVAQSPPARDGWQQTLDERLAEFGHRNWIAVVDSAYPAQTSPGVETIVTGGDHLEVVKSVLSRLSRARHVRPVIYLDAELAHIDPADAPGVDQFRADLAQLLPKEGVNRLAHGEIIDALDAAGQRFRILILKTNMTLPYTSVFIELDCGYWSSGAERRLRERMNGAGE